MKKYIIPLATLLSLSLVLFSCDKEKKELQKYAISLDKIEVSTGDPITYTIKDGKGAEVKDLNVVFEVKGKDYLSSYKPEVLIAVDKEKHILYPCFPGEMEIVAKVNDQSLQPVTLQVSSKYLSPDNFKTEGGVYRLKEKEFIQNVYDFKTTPNLPILKVDKPVIVKFGATWCGYCLKEKPVLEELADKYEDKVFIIDIDTDTDSYGKKLYNLFYNLRNDKKHFGKPGSLPYTVMIAPGTLKMHSMVGWHDSMKQNLVNFIEGNQLKK